MSSSFSRLGVVSALALAGLMACGGSGAASDAPNYGTVAFDMESADASTLQPAGHRRQRSDLPSAPVPADPLKWWG